MAITASQVKELREITGLGMMECKQALTETDGDIDAAIEVLRKKAGAKVEKKASRTAAEGAIGITVSGDRKSAAMVEVNSETDFVAKGDEFMSFAQAVAETIVVGCPTDISALQEMQLVGSSDSVAKSLEAMVVKLGEKMTVRRYKNLKTDGHIGSYVHGRKIGVLVELEGGDDVLAKDIAMHIAALSPAYVNKDDVPAEVVDKEKEIFSAQAKESGKADEIIEKMVVGRVNKFLNEICLLGQPFVKEPDLTIEKLLKGAGASVESFIRYEVGEGIEKAEDDFAAEVMAQVKGG